MKKKKETKKALYHCYGCGNGEEFTAEYSLHGEYVVDQYGEEVDGITSPVRGNPHVDDSWDTEHRDVIRCAKCGSNDIFPEEHEERVKYPERWNKI